MNATVLPHGSPESQGVDPAGIMAFLDALDPAPDVELHSLMIIRHGCVVAEGWWSPYTPNRPHLLYSLSKSFVSTATGFAVAEGLLDLDQTVLSYFPELDGEITDLLSRSMLVRHVAAMASGHLAETLEQTMTLDPVEPVRGFLLIPPDREPGTVFAYNQPCTYTLAAIVQRQTDQTLTEYLRPRLFEPLGIDQAGWQQHPDGRDIGFTGLHATTDAITRLGLLYLQRGRWNGTRLLSDAWVAEATRTQVENPNEPNLDWRQGYGFQFWMAQHGYRGDGAYGQFCLVLPQQDAVIATTGASDNMQAVLDAAWNHLLPAMTTPVSTSLSPVGGQLASRLSQLQLPCCPGAPAPKVSGAAWNEAVFTPAEAPSEAQRTLTGIRLDRDGGDQWQLTLLEAQPGEHITELSATIGLQHWQTNADEPGPGRAGVPMAVSGGWTDEDTFRAEVIFSETPHRLELTCVLASRTFRASWHTVPLRAGRLSELRMPR